VDDDRFFVRRTFFAVALTLSSVTPARAAEDPRHLPVGDPARRDREAPLALDALTDTARGDFLAPADLPARLAGVRLLLVGESHTSAEAHRVERRVLEELARSGRPLLVGLEMYPATEQRFLDDWVAGRLSEEAFLSASRWYEHWSYPFGYYRDIFLFAREKSIPLVAVNAPRAVVSAVRQKGIAGLSAEEAAQIPIPTDADSLEHMRLFRASLGDEGFHSGMSEEDWKRLFAAQCTWDAAMAGHAIRALEKSGDGKAILVLLAGAGHVEYGLGIARQAAGFPGRIATLLPVPVADEKGRPVRTVRASYADFLWGVPLEGDPLYPPLGVSVRPVGGQKALDLIHVEEESLAEREGLAAGDRLLALDGSPLPDRETFYRLMAGKGWGDEVRLLRRRGQETRELKVPLRRRAPGADAPARAPVPSPGPGSP
jgi:uncharacterized iron-regulated protein